MTTRLLLSAASGWLAVVSLAVTVRLPYRLRLRLPFAAAADRPLSFRPRLRLHYRLGYAIAGLAVVHGWLPMTRSIVGRAHAAGLQLATLALLLVLVEVGLGLVLRRRLQRARPTLRRIHFWVMTALLVLVATHIVLDSALLGTFHPAPAGLLPDAPAAAPAR
jgi:hypothetical protein